MFFCRRFNSDSSRFIFRQPRSGPEGRNLDLSPRDELDFLMDEVGADLWIGHEQENEHAYFETPANIDRNFQDRAELGKVQVQTPSGESLTLFYDVGCVFIYVNPGDTLGGIRNRLSSLDEFSYLEDMRGPKDTQFNVPATKVQAHDWIPIPLEQTDRMISNGDFVDYCKLGLNDIKAHPKYGPYFREVARLGVTDDDLLVLMLTVAKIESGGKPLGTNSLHRYEPHHNSFSFSHFHILMKGAGDDAQMALQMGEGQSYHPRNGAKLFLAFVVEKFLDRSITDVEDVAARMKKFLPLDGNYEAFSRFYNGNAPDSYIRDLERHHLESKGEFENGFPEISIPERAEFYRLEMEARDVRIYQRPRTDDLRTVIEDLNVTIGLGVVSMEKLYDEAALYMGVVYGSSSMDRVIDRVGIGGSGSDFYVVICRGDTCSPKIYLDGRIGDEDGEFVGPLMPTPAVGPQTPAGPAIAAGSESDEVSVLSEYISQGFNFERVGGDSLSVVIQRLERDEVQNLYSTALYVDANMERVTNKKYVQPNDQLGLGQKGGEWMIVLCRGSDGECFEFPVQ
jgi:hypothetical protein